MDWSPFLRTDLGNSTGFYLEPNFPNPFNAATTLRYVVPGATGIGAASRPVRLVIRNTLGQEVKTLINGTQYPGVHCAVWDGTDGSGSALAGGVYLYTMSAPGFTATRRMMMVR